MTGPADRADRGETSVSQGPAEDLADSARRAISTAQADRERYLTELSDVAGARTAATGEDPAMTVLRDTSLPAQSRIEVLRRLGASLIRRPAYIDALLAVATDTGDDPGVRGTALQLLGSAAFQVLRFRPHRQAYEDALHDLVGDPEPALRAVAVSTLAQEHDPAVQETLLAGLRGEGPLPVERERAILLLAEDDHLDNLPWLEELYRDGSDATRAEAVRFMASYPQAQPTLERVLRDRDEAGDVRRQSAAALRYLAPERFEAVAKDIAVDAEEDPDVRTACLSTLHRLGETEHVYADAEFVDRVQEVSSEAPPQVARAARDLLDGRPDR
jgi:HEAT repeat protein